MELLGSTLVVGPHLGAIYGAKVGSGEINDHFGITKLRPHVLGMVERGILEIYEIGPAAVIGPGCLPLPRARHRIRDALKDSDARPVDVVKSSTPPVVYRASFVGDRVTIAQDQVPGFLADNGIKVMDPAELSIAMKARLETSMSLLDCQCIAQRKASSGGMGSTVGSMRESFAEKMKPGDVIMSFHMESDFNAYLNDKSAFEDMLKSEILRALGIDPEKVPNAKRSLTILDVREGSVWAFVLIGVCLLVAATVISAIVNAAFHAKVPVVRTPSIRPAPTIGSEAPTAGAASDVFRTQGGHRLVDSPAPTIDVPAPIESTTRAVVHELAMGPRRPLQEIRFVNHNDGGWEVIGQLGADVANRCFVPHTLLQVSHHEYREVQALKVGDTVFGSTGRLLEVAYIQKYPRERRELVTIRTAQAEVTVTADHRVVVASGDGVSDWKTARELQVGEEVFCGRRLQRVTRLLPQHAPVEIVEIRFNPDDPVETRLLPSWGILTRGARPPCAIRAMGRFGPITVDDLRGAPRLRQRARSA